MNTHPDATDLAPPEPPGRAGAIALALAAHAALIAALALGVQWNRVADTTPVLAELWSAVPREAAPRAQAPEPAPPPPPAPAAAPPTPAPEAEIALERERRRQALAQERERERQREEALVRQRKAEADKAAARKAQAERVEQERRNREQAQKIARENDARAREDQRRKADQAARRKAAEDKVEAERIETQRQENLRRMAGLAGATGSETARGTAEQASGPTAGYGARVEARVRPNIVFADADRVSGNPAAEVEVRSAPDGTILSTRLVKSSGLRAWDEAVLRAIEKTEVLPRDVDSRVPSPLLIVLRPKR